MGDGSTRSVEKMIIRVGLVWDLAWNDPVHDLRQGPLSQLVHVGHAAEIWGWLGHGYSELSLKFDYSVI